MEEVSGEPERDHADLFVRPRGLSFLECRLKGLLPLSGTSPARGSECLRRQLQCERGQGVQLLRSDPGVPWPISGLLGLNAVQFGQLSHLALMLQGGGARAGVDDFEVPFPLFRERGHCDRRPDHGQAGRERGLPSSGTGNY